MRTIWVNGAEQPLGDDVTLRTLVAEQVPGAVPGHGDGRPRGVAVAINETIVPRGAWDTTDLRSGDHVEIVTAVQGG